MWVFDGPGGTGRVLRQRDGHSAPPCIARFYGDPAHTILSAGHDKAVRMFSTIRDARSKEMSQGHVESKAKRLNISGDSLRLGPVIALAAEEIREREWANVITAHLHNTKVRTWNTVKGAMDSVVLNAKVEPVSPASAVALTTCGNISFVGYNAGHLAAYNIQSGNLRGLFCRSGNYAHKGKVTGIETDNINMNVLSVGLDKHLRVWDLGTRKHVKELELPEPAVKTCIQRDSNLLAVALITFDVVVVDLDTMRVVRTFTGQSNTITDMCFSGNGKWLVLSSMDGSVRVWDLPTGRLIDCFCADSPVTSLSLTPTGEYLATTHVDQNGIYLWCNKTLYGPVNLKPLPNDAEPKEVTMPMSEVAEGVEQDEEESEEREDDEEEIDMEWKSRDQLDKMLITLSDVPKSRWNTLCNLDIIKKRNKPKEPPKAPKSAPFFLGTTRELVPKFIVEEEPIPEEKVSSKVLKMSSSQTPFQTTLLASVEQGEVEGVMKMMEEMTPSALDIELQTMCPEDGGSEELVSAFVSLLILCLESRRDYDVVQAYLNVFIKHNRGYLCSTLAIQDKLRTLQTLHTDTWTEMQVQLQKCLCVSQYIKTKMVTKTELCSYTENRIYPGRGRRHIGKDGKTYFFISTKARSMFHQKIKSVKLTWTLAWRRFNKKIRVDELNKKRKTKTHRVQKAVVGMSLDEIKRRRAETRADRDAKHDVAVKEIKERKVKEMAAKKAEKTKQAQAQKAQQKNQPKAAAKPAQKGGKK